MPPLHIGKYNLIQNVASLGNINIQNTQVISRSIVGVNSIFGPDSVLQGEKITASMMPVKPPLRSNKRVRLISEKPHNGVEDPPEELVGRQIQG
jgi:hypothetical protein